MRKAAILAVILLLFTLGCVSDTQVPSSRKEVVTSSDAFDLDGDGLFDAYYYKLAPYPVPGTSTTIQKYILVSAENEFSFSNFNPIDLEKRKKLEADFEEFVSNKENIETECTHNIGLFGVRCLDANSCLKLCSSGSQKCKTLSTTYGDVLGASILQYMRDSTELHNSISNILDDLQEFNSSSLTKKNVFVGELAKISSYVYSINANPIMNSDIFGLCEPNDYSLQEIPKFAKALGQYEVTNTGYKYHVFIKINSEKSKSTLEYADLKITEILPADYVSEVQVLGSQQVSTSTKNGKFYMEWPVLKPYAVGNTLFGYDFFSKTDPSQLVPMLDRPEVTVKTLNLAVLGPVAFLFNSFMGISGNYYLSIGLSFALTLILLILLFNAIVIVYHIIKARSAGEDTGHALKRAIGRTGMRWKTDSMLGAVLLIGGLLTAFFYAPHTDATFDVFKITELLTNADLLSGFVAAFFIFAGVYLLFSAVENYLKITALEKVYGKHFVADKDLFITRVSQLKDKINELTELVSKLGKENFEVGTEYDVLSRISVKHVDELAKKGDSHARRLVEEYLTHVEDAVDGLLERKKTADENWQNWSNEIAKLVDQHDEVYVSNLVTIPASLRLWALNKFASENIAKGITFEGDVIRRKAVTPEKLTKTLLDTDLLIGAIVVKNGKLLMTRVSSGNGTVSGVLTIKLLNYLRTMTTKLRMHEYKNLAVVGEKNVMALLKYGEVESIIIMKKEKFKEAVESWKEKLKGF